MLQQPFWRAIERAAVLVGPPSGWSGWMNRSGFRGCLLAWVRPAWS